MEIFLSNTMDIEIIAIMHPSDVLSHFRCV